MECEKVMLDYPKNLFSVYSQIYVHKIIFNFFIVILLRENKQFDSERRWQKHVINFRSCFSVLLYIMIIFSIYILFVQFLALVWRIMWFFEIKTQKFSFFGKILSFGSKRSQQNRFAKNTTSTQPIAGYTNSKGQPIG